MSTTANAELWGDKTCIKCANAPSCPGGAEIITTFDKLSKYTGKIGTLTDLLQQSNKKIVNMAKLYGK